MPLVIGLCLIPLVVLIIISANSVKTTRKAKFWLNFSLVALVILYFVFVAVVNKEPFKKVDFIVLFADKTKAVYDVVNTYHQAVYAFASA